MGSCASSSSSSVSAQAYMSDLSYYKGNQPKECDLELDLKSKLRQEVLRGLGSGEHVFCADPECAKCLGTNHMPL